MKSNAGLWIDHREALIVVLTKAGAETTHVQPAAVETHRGEPANGQVAADDQAQRSDTEHRARFYKEVAGHLEAAGSILILGPGEAKTELGKQLKRKRGDTRKIVMENAGKLTEPQLVDQVRRHFKLSAARRGA